MKQINSSTQFLFNIAKFQTSLTRRLDSCLGGLGLSELVILYHLSQSANQTMRRIDLASKVGLTASGITRLLLPMEKIGLIKKEAHAHDARVSHVVLAPGGKTKLSEGIERIELFCEELIPSNKIKKIEDLSALLVEIRKNMI